MTSEPSFAATSAGNDEPGPSPRPRSLLNLLFDRTRVEDAVLNYSYQGKGSYEHPYIVDWLPEDTGNPLNWSKFAKWRITMASAVTCFAVAFSSSAYTGTIRELMVHFRASDTLTTAGVSLYVLGFALGPLIWAPLSEIYGRQLIFLVSYGLYVVFSVACVADNGMATLLILRFFAGTFGSSPLTNAGGVISDVFHAEDRSIAMGIFSLAPAMGPTLGPFIGGYLGQSEGWRWVMGLMGILAGVCWILGLGLIPETYAPFILKNRALVLSARTGRVYVSAYERGGQSDSPTMILKKALLRPWQLLLVEPIVLILSIYTAIVYGTLYMLFGAYPVVFQLERGWSAGEGGLAFLGIAFGMVLALPTVACMNIWYMKVAQASSGGVAPPEARLPGGMLGGITVPAGMFWFAWTTYSSIHWMSPVASGILFGLGMTLIFHSIFNYLIDAYGEFAASALAANTVLRSLFGAAFPLFTRQMYDNLGTQWASSVPAFLALLCLPMPFFLYKHGAAIRRKCKFSAKVAGDAATVVEDPTMSV